MIYALVIISGFSIAIPALIGILRSKSIEPAYYPFLILICVGLINEVLNFFLIRAHYSNKVNSNIYSLAESLLIVLFFKRLGLFERSTWFFYANVCFFILLWLFDNFILFERFSSYFTVITSFVYVLMSITMINRLIVGEIKILTTNPVFIICIGFILFFTCALIVGIFWIYGLNASNEFLLQVYLIKTSINIVVNLIYAFAILWMPKKREYTLL